MHTARRWAVAVLFSFCVALASAASPSRAAAQDYDSSGLQALGWAIAIPGIAVGAALELSFIGIELEAAGRGRWASTGAGIYEVVANILVLLPLGPVTAAVWNDQRENELDYVMPASLALHAWYLIHGIVSIAHGNDPSPSLTPSVAVTADGATLSLAGRF